MRAPLSKARLRSSIVAAVSSMGWAEPWGTPIVSSAVSASRNAPRGRCFMGWLGSLVMNPSLTAKHIAEADRKRRDNHGSAFVGAQTEVRPRERRLAHGAAAPRQGGGRSRAIDQLRRRNSS